MPNYFGISHAKFAIGNIPHNMECRNKFGIPCYELHKTGCHTFYIFFSNVHNDFFLGTLIRTYHGHFDEGRGEILNARHVCLAGV
jgi:hypothetical protein